jgi:ArsR family metal-binding transcriptional regulator
MAPNDQVLIVYPREEDALLAMEKFQARSISFDPVRPPEHLRDVASPAVRVARDELGAILDVSKKERLLHVGIVDWRPPADGAGNLDRFQPRGEPLFLETVQLTFVAACMADDTKLRFIAQFDRDIAEVFPYLNARIKGAMYNPAVPTLGFPLAYRMITLYGTRLAVGKTDEIVDSWRTMAWVKDLVNETWQNRASIEPCTEQRERPQPLEIYKRLPRTNCRDCGEPSCMAFAARLARGEARLASCPHMYTAPYEGMRAALLALFPGLEAESENPGRS